MNTHIIYMKYLSLIASGERLQSDLLGPANMSRITPSPIPEKLVECMTVVACLKLFHKYNDHCSEYSKVCGLIHSPYFEDIDLPNTCYGQ